MKSRLFTLLSALLPIPVAILFLRSLFFHDVFIANGEHCLTILSQSGLVTIILDHTDPLHPRGLRYFSARTSLGLYPWGFLGSEHWYNRLGFAHESGHAASNLIHLWVFPHYFPLLLSLLPLSFILYHRLNRRPRPDHCPKCNYDLRASKDQCPECGTPFRPPPEPPQACTHAPPRAGRKIAQGPLQ